MDEGDFNKNRINLAVIRKVDPYAKHIVDSSSHVAFYTFNSAQNEWEKTDVEGVFFIYSRTAEPFHSIFINNRLNTTSFVEPITRQLELQTQPPFLLYRNERSRIRGFWFYNSVECSRIGNLVSALVLDVDRSIHRQGSADNSRESANIFKMLSQAQLEHAASMTNVRTSAIPPRNVLNFFAAAKPTPVGLQIKKWFPTTVYVEQLEKQHRIATPEVALISRQLQSSKKILSNDEVQSAHTSKDQVSAFVYPQMHCSSKNENSLGLIVNDEPEDIQDQTAGEQENNDPVEVSPKNMYESVMHNIKISPLTKIQFVEALSHLLKNDDEFVYKLHNTYLNILSSKMVIG